MMPTGARRRLPLALSGLALLCAAALLPPLADARQSGQLQIRQALEDEQFGVATGQPGLQRRVEMYQWRREGDGFVTDWVSRVVDSSGFPQAMHNPSRMPVTSRFWLADEVRVDGHPLDMQVLQALGRWQRFRPSFNRLPGHVGSRFQPEGDGLGSAEDPQYPKVGDVRITWHELRLPPLQGNLQLVSGRWQLADGGQEHAADAADSMADDGVMPQAAGSPAGSAQESMHPPAAGDDALSSAPMGHTVPAQRNWPLVIAIIAIVLLGGWLRSKRRLR